MRKGKVRFLFKTCSYKSCKQRVVQQIPTVAINWSIYHHPSLKLWLHGLTKLSRLPSCSDGPNPERRRGNTTLTFMWKPGGDSWRLLHRIRRYHVAQSTRQGLWACCRGEA
eukprot:scaffold24499_cov19-Tisochrysis_lutea.AAC.1